MAVDCVEIHLNRMFHLSSHDNFNVSSNYEKAVKRTGHARFRRGPSSSPATDSHGTSTSAQSEDNKQLHAPSDVRNDCFSNKSVTETTSSTSSGADGSVSNGKQFSSLGIIAPAPTFSSRKPPLPSTHRKRCSADRPVASVHGSEKQSHNYSVSRRKIGSVTPSDNCSVSRSGCHCCKRRKTGSIIRRVPIIGSKVTSIPADDYSWKKYGEKKIDGSLYPRVYYKCNTGKGCPARKRVELSKDDSKMLLVSYDGEHRHRVTLTPVPLSLTGVVV